MAGPTIPPIDPDTGGGSTGGGISKGSGAADTVNRGYDSGLKGFTLRELKRIIRGLVPPTTSPYGGEDIPTLNISGSGAFDINADGFIYWPDTGAYIQTTGVSALTIFNDVTIPGDFTLSGLTSGSVLFAGAGGIVAQDNPNFFWDDANNRLGIGTTIPTHTLTVSGDAIIVHTASEADNDALGLKVDAAGFGGVKAYSH